jgi:hypothetical protein
MVTYKQHKDSGPSPRDTSAHTWGRTRTIPSEDSSFSTTRILAHGHGHVGLNMQWKTFLKV